MGVDQIVHVHVITDAGAIRRVIVGAEDRDRVALPQRNVKAYWNQMCFRMVILTQPAVAVAAGDVEVAQGGKGEFLASGRLRVQVVKEHLLHGQLRPAVGIDRPLRAVFRDGDVLRGRLAVGCTGAGEDKSIDAGLLHRVQQ